MGNSIYNSEVIFKQILNLKLEQHYRRIVLSHIMTILMAVFSMGYGGKTTQMSAVSEKHRSGDDTIASKTKPSLQAMRPMEAAYFHQSHLKKKQYYGHQAVEKLGFDLCVGWTFLEKL